MDRYILSPLLILQMLRFFAFAPTDNGPHGISFDYSSVIDIGTPKCPFVSNIKKNESIKSKFVHSGTYVNLFAFGAFRLWFYNLFLHFTDGTARDAGVPSVSHDFPVLWGLPLPTIPHPISKVQDQPWN